MPRPQFNPTDDQRRQVKSMAAIGLAHEDIARKIGLRSPKTLRKHFRQELDHGVIDAKIKIGRTLFEMGTSGEYPAATIFLAKTRLGLRERPADSSRPTTPLPFIVTCEPGGPAHDHA